MIALVWLYVAVVWTVAAVAMAVVIGKGIRMADRIEQPDTDYVADAKRLDVWI